MYIERELHNAIEKLPPLPDGTKLIKKIWETDLDFNFIDRGTVQRSKISYIPNRYVEEYIDSSDKHSFRARRGIVTRPGRFLKKLGIDDYDFVHKFQAVICDDIEILEVSGEDIRKYYLGSNYDTSQDTDSLANSCMKHTTCQEYMDIYVDNVEMIIVRLKGSSKIIGRAIKWSDVSTNSDEHTNITFVDRIYGTSTTVEIVKAYCKEKGYYHKQYQSYSEPLGVVAPNGDKMDLEMTVSIPNGYEYYPYMDTFRNLNNNADTIFNYYDDSDIAYNLQCTEGGPEIGSRITCACCDEYLREEDAYTIHDGDQICPGCRENHYTQCSCCSELYDNNDMRETSRGYSCEDCYIDNHSQCRDCGGMYHNDTIHTDKNDKVCEDCYEERKEKEKEDDNE